MVSLTVPLPLAVQVAPPVAEQIQLCEAIPTGTASLTVVPSAATEPLLRTVTVYCTVPPGTKAVVLALLVTSMIGAEPRVTDAVQGAAVLAGAHTPAPPGVLLAVLVTVAGGALLTLAVMV